MPGRENLLLGEGKPWGLRLVKAIKLSKKEKDSSQMMAGKKDIEEKEKVPKGEEHSWSWENGWI